MDTFRYLGESVGILDSTPAEETGDGEKTEKDHERVYDAIPISELFSAQGDANSGDDSELQYLKEQRRQILQLMEEQSREIEEQELPKEEAPPVADRRFVLVNEKEHEVKSSEEHSAHAEHESFLAKVKHEAAHLLHLDGKEQEEQESAGKDQWYLWHANDQESKERAARQAELAAVEEAHRVQHWHLEAAQNSLEATSPEVETPPRRKRISFAPDEDLLSPPPSNFEATSPRLETPVKEISFASNDESSCNWSPRNTRTSSLFRGFAGTRRSLLSPVQKYSLHFRKDEKPSLLPPDLAAAIDDIARSDYRL